RKSSVTSLQAGARKSRSRRLNPFADLGRPGRVRSPVTAMRRRAMKLYGFGPTRSLRALWGLKELGAEFEFQVVNLLAGEHQRPEFLRLNPAGQLPVLDIR